MKFKGEIMEEKTLNQDKQQLVKNIERCRIIFVADFILLICSIVSLVFSIVTKENKIIESKEIGYIIVIVVMIIIFASITPMYVNLKRQIKELDK